MVSKVNGIKIYPKHSLGCILSASFGVFVGFMLLTGLTLFPVFGATINGSVMQVNAFDYFADVLARSPMNFGESITTVGLGNALKSMGDVTHFLGLKKYNLQLLEYFETFRSSSNIENYAVTWYCHGVVDRIFDVSFALTYALLMLFGLALFIEGIIRLATGTYHKNARPFTIVCFFIIVLFIISSFVTDFCMKYIAKEVMLESETYEHRICAMQYVLFFICLAAWIGQHWVYSRMIKGKLYVAEARLIRKSKKDEDKEAQQQRKKGKKQKEPEPIIEEIVEEVPLEEVQKEPIPEEPTIVEEPAKPENSGPQEAPIEEPKPAEQVEENKASNNEANVPKAK